MRIWKGFQKGVNLGGWFSQCSHTQEHYQNFIGEEDFCNLSAWGIDHVRLPVDYNLVEKKDGSYCEEGFAYIRQVLNWCEKYDLNMILDLHKTAGYSFDPDERETGFFTEEKYQQRFYRLWEEFAKRFGGQENRIAFELLNEVVEKECSEKWNQIADTCIQRIREICPSIPILVGGYWNNCVAAVKDLGMPQDENIIYNFHCYEPLIFTHQGAGWVKGMTSEFRFSFDHTIGEIEKATAEKLPEQLGLIPKSLNPDRTLDAEFFKEMFQEAVRVAQERDVCLYCGEYGVIDRAQPAEAVKWYRAIHQAFEELGIGRATWTYRGLNYGLTDPSRAEVLEEIKKYL